jgi:hypothetical protein
VKFLRKHLNFLFSSMYNIPGKQENPGNRAGSVNNLGRNGGDTMKRPRLKSTTLFILPVLWALLALASLSAECPIIDDVSAPDPAFVQPDRRNLSVLREVPKLRVAVDALFRVIGATPSQEDAGKPPAKSTSSDVHRTGKEAKPAESASEPPATKTQSPEDAAETGRHTVKQEPSQ